MTTIAPEAAVTIADERKIPNYRQQLKKALPAEVFQPHYGFLAWFPVHMATIGLGWYLLANHFSFWAAPFITIVVGHAMACMGFLSHDVLHGGTVKKLFWRDLVGGFGFSPLWIAPSLWRKWHNAEHHGHTQVEGVDPDHLFTMEHYEKNPVLQFLYKIHPLLRNIIIFSSFTYRMQQQTLRMLFTYLLSGKTKTRDKVIMTTQTIVAIGGWVALSLAFGTQVLIWGYLLPIFVANTVVIAYIATNHFLNPLADESDVLASSLTVTLPKWLGWLDVLHNYFGAHVAHHLFPQIAPKHARMVEKKAAELFPEQYQAMPWGTALKLLWQTPWVYENKKMLVDPVRDEHVPTLGSGLENRVKKRHTH